MVLLLHKGELQRSELNIAKIVEFAGGEVQFLRLSPGDSAGVRTVVNQIPRGACVIARADALAGVATADPLNGDLLRQFTSRVAKCLVYDFNGSEEHNRLLSFFTSEGLVGVNSMSAKVEFCVDAGSREVCRQFAGLRFGSVDPNYDSGFIEGTKQSSCVSLIRVGSQPFFVLAKKDNCDLFLLACRAVADLNEPVTSSAIVPFFSRLAPLLMFLYQTGREHYWYNNTPRACFIIDDPLLRNRYGFLDFKELLELMEREHFSTSIAFIPWNYRRSSSRTIKLFERFPDLYTLCVHGCDHTGGEFAECDLNYLCEQAQKALQRMHKHLQITGIGFDNVMVFPQGRFSVSAMEALKSSGYLAAVNSTPCPVDLNGEALRLEDLLESAVSKFSGFPLFVRRYPKDLAGLAFDLFLGKPALLVEHHGYFRNGYAPLTDTVRKINGVEGRIQWGRLSTICSEACLQRRAENGDVHVRFYTDRFQLQNNSRQPQRFLLIRRGMPPAALPNVAIDGSKVQSEFDAGELRFTTELRPGQSVAIQVQCPNKCQSVPQSRRKPVRQAAVFLRRHLSEFRDNYLDRSALASRVTSQVRNRLVGRGRQGNG